MRDDIVEIFIITLIIFILYLCITIFNENQKNKLYKLAYIDAITNLGNYYFFCKEGEKLIKHGTYIIILDINKFKTFNRKYGYEIGDKILKNVGQKVKKILNMNDMVCRFSNDVFGLLINHVQDIEKLIENIQDSLKNIKIEEKTYNVYSTIGIYKVSNDNISIKESIDKALIAHDNIKFNYNKNYNIYNEKMEKRLLEEHEIESKMEKALNNNEFIVYYQPKIPLKDNINIEAEALIRWSDDGKIIKPNTFIPVFEKNGFIKKIDIYVYEDVCKLLKELKKYYKKLPIISINVSKENFYVENFISEYVRIANKYEINTNNIELEITESVALDETIDISYVIGKIKEKGFRISIDDFGTGYSSFNMLLDMKIDTIKIDKKFIDCIKKEENNLVNYIIYMAKDLNLKTVAEGVENKMQIDYLKDIGCDIVQGYYYSKPLPKDELKKYIDKFLKNY